MDEVKAESKYLGYRHDRSKIVFSIFFLLPFRLAMQTVPISLSVVVPFMYKHRPYKNILWVPMLPLLEGGSEFR